MDAFRKKLVRELEQMQQAGRILRNMSLAQMVALEAGGWQPAADVYEAGDEVFLYFDLAGVDGDSLDVLVEEQQVLVRGRRQLRLVQGISCIHQLEIELGSFERTVSLPALVDTSQASSLYKDGILLVRIRKKANRGRVRVHIDNGA